MQEKEHTERFLASIKHPAQRNDRCARIGCSAQIQKMALPDNGLAEVAGIGLFNSGLQIDLRLPAGLEQPGAIHQFLLHAIRFGGIPDALAFKTDHRSQDS